MKAVNVCRLEHNKKGEVEVIAWGDVHIGNHTCNLKKATGYIDYAIKHNQYVIGMGDLMECVLPGSKGSIFEQNITPDEQIAKITDILRPLAEVGRIIGLHLGNHCERIYSSTSINPIAIICRELKVPYLGSASYQLWKVGNQSYKVYSTHGRSNARLPQTKLLACRKLVDIATAEIYLMGHLHSLETSAAIYYDIKRGKKVVSTRHFCITGSFLDYENSYAETMCLNPARTGAPRITLESEKHDIHISL